MWWVYVIQSQKTRLGRTGKNLPGFHYVGCTTDVFRRLREHNGLYANGKNGNPKGSKYTSKHRPWVLRAIFGPYENRSEAQKAEYTLKHTKKSTARVFWSQKDSDRCCGLGAADPDVEKFNIRLSDLKKQ